MKRIAACVLLGLACSDAAAASARCHIIYGGEEWTIDAAPTGQPARQSPQPVQADRSRRSCMMPPSAGTTLTARVSQASAHRRHSMRWCIRQVEPM